MKRDRWNERYGASDRVFPTTPNLFLADRLKSAEPGVGLDLASGEGRNAIWLQSKGWQMTAVDFSEVGIERGRSERPDVEWVVADVLEWEPDKTFDLIVVAYLHLGEELLGSLIRKAATWLNPGGELFLIGHDKTNLETGIGGPQDPEILWSVEPFREWLSDLEIIEAVVVRLPADTDEGKKFWRDTLVRARASLRTESD